MKGKTLQEKEWRLVVIYINDEMNSQSGSRHYILIAPAGVVALHAPPNGAIIAPRRVLMFWPRRPGALLKELGRLSCTSPSYSAQFCNMKSQCRMGTSEKKYTYRIRRRGVKDVAPILSICTRWDRMRRQDLSCYSANKCKVYRGRCTEPVARYFLFLKEGVHGCNAEFAVRP